MARGAVVGAGLVGLLAALGPPAPAQDDAGRRILAFSKTAGFRHASIPDGVAALRRLGSENGFEVDWTEDASVFDDVQLDVYDAVVFLLTTGDVLSTAEQGAFERYIRSGRGFVGIQSAADTEYGWPWYTGMGHTGESYSESRFLAHLLGGVQFAAGWPDCESRPRTRALPPR